MNFIEIDNKLINLDNVTMINVYEGTVINKWMLNINFNGSEEDYINVKYDNKEQVESEYNRIKSILIGDNNE